MKITTVKGVHRVYIAGHCYPQEESGWIIWTVSRYTETADGELLRQDVLAYGEARGWHGAKSIIAKKCKQFDKEETT